MHILKNLSIQQISVDFYDCVRVCGWRGLDFDCFQNTDLIGISRATIRKYFADHSQVYTYFITSAVCYRRVMNT